ncbi:hypothetical protein L2E82_47179 [Cichorium intybus]|uniref:Uncharacterized protein n=1 Tax=Cichorium intybus TaxID=13427 RepID=A0ACB8YUU1_CICIN|nr:hypothetical protein L2E82_47179 [Cichorium intybus]
MKEQEEKIAVAAVIRKKIDKKKMRSDVTLKKKKKITKKKSDVQQLEGDFYKNDNVNEDWMDSGPSVPRFDIILDGSKSIELQFVPEVNEDAEVSDELRTFKKKNKDVQDSEEIGDVQLDQLVAGSLFLATRDPREKVYESPHGFVGIVSYS